MTHLAIICIQYREVTFDLQFRINSCDHIDLFNEGVELSYRSLTENRAGEWVPLAYYVDNSVQFESHDIVISENISRSDHEIVIRGYTVPYTHQSRGHHSVTLCEGDIVKYPLQFRWLQTSRHLQDIIRDAVLLDNVFISAQNVTLLADNFDSHTGIK